MRGDFLSYASDTSVFFDNALDGTSGETAKITRSINGLLISGVIKKKGREEHQYGLLDNYRDVRRQSRR